VACSSEIEPQDRKPALLKDACYSIHDFVVHRSAKERMGVTDNSRFSRIRSGSLPNRLDAPRRTIDEKIAF
jgi:hypothetical protein